ncbi:hypothetical protein [Streptomyces canus]|nr:hypothetical protein [Streptomyces canus]
MASPRAEGRECFLRLLPKNVLDHRVGAAREEMRMAIVAWVEPAYY